MSFDPKCYDLAVEFLEEINPPDRVYDRLAQTIQDAIEDFLQDEDNAAIPNRPSILGGSAMNGAMRAAEQQRLK